jgi:Fe-S cluster biosynthesis and repair protein YggX
MPDADGIQCVRCGAENADPLAAPPFRDELGQRVLREICRDCWEEWKQRQMLLINHFGLNVRDSEAREFLRRNLRDFLFDEGPGGAEIDVSREGDVEW